MGRRTKGAAKVRDLRGSREARERLEAILRLIAGEIPLAEAEARTGLSTSRLDVLRLRVLEAGLAALEPRPRGRPRRGTAEVERTRALELELAHMREELEVERVRTEIALTMPHVLKKKRRVRRRE